MVGSIDAGLVFFLNPNYPQEDKTKVGGVLCCGGKKVSTETHYQGELTKYLSEV